MNDLQSLPNFEFVPIPAGEFLMGDGICMAAPIHKVHISPFEMGKYPVTENTWEIIMSGGRKKGGATPVVDVSWKEVQEFVTKLNKRDMKYRYRLPSESEWEYAARANATEEYGEDLGDYAWFNGNSKGQSHPVGKKLPNAFGLYDMLGNVHEWVQDCFSDYKVTPVDGTAMEGTQDDCNHVFRGGSWHCDACELNTTWRYVFAYDSSYDVGFRLVREPRCIPIEDRPGTPSIDVSALVKEVKALKKEVQELRKEMNELQLLKTGR